jgi:hypothetical protein
VPVVEEGAVQEVQQVRLPQDGVMVEVPLPVLRPVAPLLAVHRRQPVRREAVAEQQGRHPRHHHLRLSHRSICG